MVTTIVSSPWVFFICMIIVTFTVGFSRSTSTGTHQNDSTAELFNCLSNVTLTYFDRRTVYMHFNETWCLPEYTAAVDSFAKAVQSPKVIIPYASFGGARLLTKGVFAFLAEDRQYEQLLNITSQSYFVALWTKETAHNDIRLAFREFWSYNHINVVGLVMMDDGTVNAYTYRPFSSYGCGKLGRPYLLDRWQNGAFQRGVDLFSVRSRIGNMRGCPLKCVGNEQPPDALVRLDNRQQWTASGVGGMMLQIVAGHMNFTPVITSPKGNMSEMYSWYYAEDVLDNISAALCANEVDLAFGWYSYATHNAEYNTELAKTTSIDCVGWAVPYRAGPRPQSWTYYVYEFDKVGWLLIGSMFIVVVGVFYFFRKLNKLHRIDSVLFFVYHTAIDQPLRVQPAWCSLRAFTIHWLWYSMVINVAYKASLGSFMTVPSHGIDFTRMDQILDSNLIMMASPRSMHIMNATTSTTRLSRTFMERIRMLPATDFERVIDRLVVKRDVALLEVKRFMYYYSVPQAKRIKVKIPMRFLPGCLLRTHTTQFMFASGSYLTESVDAVLSTLFETGIVEHWITHLGSNKVLPLEKIRGRVLKMVRLREAFLFLLFGYTAASAVLVAEIYWSKRTPRRQQLFQRICPCVFGITSADGRTRSDDSVNNGCLGSLRSQRSSHRPQRRISRRNVLLPSVY